MADEVAGTSSACIIYILLSYVITIDAEIVHAIEGKGQQNESSTKTIQNIGDLLYPLAIKLTARLLMIIK
jgi:hypothetical protein